MQRGKLKLNTYSRDDRKKIKDYTHFILENELGFFCHPKQTKSFPPLNTSYSFPSIINVLDISIDRINEVKLNNIQHIIDTGKVFSAFFIFENKNFGNFGRFIDFVGQSRLGSVEVAFKYPPPENILKQINEKCPKAIKVFIYNSSRNFFTKEHHKLVFRVNQSLESLIFPKTLFYTPYLNNDIVTYAVSFKQNTYYYKRLFIDSKMNVYSTMTKDYFLGNWTRVFKNKNALLEHLTDRKLKFWGIPKSKINVCQNCEFNRICVDNRVPKMRADGKWYYDIECSYNPFIGKWVGEEGYSNLRSCGISLKKRGAHRQKGANKKNKK
jgi:hypothetical protein